MSSRTVLEPKHTHSCAKKIIHRADERKRWRFWFFRIRFLLLLLFLLPLLRLLRRHHRTSADVINTPRNHIVNKTSFAYDHHHHLYNTIYNLQCTFRTASPTQHHALHHQHKITNTFSSTYQHLRGTIYTTHHHTTSSNAIYLES